MSLPTSVLNQLKQSSLSPSANKKLEKTGKAWDDTKDIHVPISKYKEMNQDSEQKNDDNEHNEEEIKSISIVHISDTHNKHERMEQLIPNGDILIHSGDFVSRCTWENAQDQQTGNYKNLPKEIAAFNTWIGKLPHKYKIVIGGNHECVFNQLSAQIIADKVLTNCIYLQDSFIELYGLKIYGSPWTPCGNFWGFGTNGYNETMYSKWNMIPNDTDILITHQPPYGIYDLAWQNTNGKLPPCQVPKCKGKRHWNYSHWGCYNLLQQVQHRIKPYLHLFGHVHDSVGHEYDEQYNIVFVNSAMDMANKPHKTNIIFDLKQLTKNEYIPPPQPQQIIDKQSNNNNACCPL